MAQSLPPLIPLGRWLTDETARNQRTVSTTAKLASRYQKESILRKLTISYGVAELLRRATARGADESAVPSICTMENFTVKLNARGDIVGVNLLRPALSVDIFEPAYLHSDIFGVGDAAAEAEDKVGKYYEVEFSDNGNANASQSKSIHGKSDGVGEKALLQKLGGLYYQLFSHLHTTKTEVLVTDVDGMYGEPPKKKRLSDTFDSDVYENDTVMPPNSVPLNELGFPQAIYQVVQNLLDCGITVEGNEQPSSSDIYDSLDTLCKDFHLLLLDPMRFLFGVEFAEGDDQQVKLAFRAKKLYGRNDEVSLITDAFCRVSGGKSEAFFIGGFSGNGKTMLVKSLLISVDVADGYVISHKFDQVSKERGLISVFDQLCLLIKRKRTEDELTDLVSKLSAEFGCDIPALSRVIPNIAGLSPEWNQLLSGQKNELGDLNLSSVNFLLQRFMRVVSSGRHPVMLYLDDMQFCSNSSVLSVFETVLTDESCCLFLVGCYRSNEIKEDHVIIQLMQRLMTTGTMTTKLSLEGLGIESLNEMISDALCMLPRLSRPLSDTVLAKTKGSPFFSIEFLKNLVDRSLLHYSDLEKRWLWDEERIITSDITDNVLFLLQAKIDTLHVTIKDAVKIASCFGIKIHGSVVKYLGSTEKHANIHAGLEQAKKEGLVILVGTSYKFLHDKIQEACINLIPDAERNQFRYNLGMLLLPMINSKDEGDVVFFVADQINQGVGNDTKVASSTLPQMDVVTINDLAGTKACSTADFISAYAYFSMAAAYLPQGSWTNRYDLTLRLSFQLARCAFSCGDLTRANDILQTITKEARSIQDKLDSYHLLTVILHVRQSLEEAYTTSYQVLKQLGETIPDRFEKKDVRNIVETIASRLSNLSEESLMLMKEMDSQNQFRLKFYSTLVAVGFFAKPGLVPFFTSRMVQLTLTHGFCVHSITGLVAFSAMYCTNNLVSDIKGASKIGKIAIAVLNRMYLSSPEVSRIYNMYYAFVAPFVEPLQSVTDSLVRGFEAGITSGDTSSGMLLNEYMCAKYPQYEL